MVAAARAARSRDLRFGLHAPSPALIEALARLGLQGELAGQEG